MAIFSVKGNIYGALASIFWWVVSHMSGEQCI